VEKDHVPGEAAARQSEKVRAHFAERAESLARAMNGGHHRRLFANLVDQ